MILYSDNVLNHRPHTYHIENPKRVEIILETLKEHGYDEIFYVDEKVSLREVLTIHDEEYINKLLSLKEFTFLDPDTYFSEGTLEAALTSLKMSEIAFKLSLKEKDLSFALTRPPGHHSGRKGWAGPTLGFCIFNNIAYAVKLAKDYFEKVIIIDFDAHHGNGTEDIFKEDDDIIIIDFHQKGIYPFTGNESYRTKINLPFISAKDDDYIYTYYEIVEPILEYYKPKIIFVSAGFDGYQGDLTDLKLKDFFQFIGYKLSDYPVCAVLEGGYFCGIKQGPIKFLNGYYHDFKERDINPSTYTKEMVNRVKSDILWLE
ncbi:histone deacetylase [Methanocaldococcus villosus KIN24-T80]|uniref:Histone deacetylase n=1 Tax=Methanocaldococcus villosus KIN24-T80 TaxID=1069083 RepID=N6VX32_9EURY|nr:histone deacetylase [Methanocaldococcus villosus]ENN95672.1 histone deacetylase [Methanocaldococcus villosus KIN24-T80]